MKIKYWADVKILKVVENLKIEPKHPTNKLIKWVQIERLTPDQILDDKLMHELAKGEIPEELISGELVLIKDCVREPDIAKSAKQDLINSKLRPAKAEEYERWLEGYINGKNSKKLQLQQYDYNFKQFNDDFFVAKKDFTLPAIIRYDVKNIYITGLLKPNSLNIIVPEDVKFCGGALGDCMLYFMKGFTTLSNAPYMPVYEDTRLPNLPQKFIQPDYLTELVRWF